MSKKKLRKRIEKQTVKHDFKHLTKSRTAAKIVQAETEVISDAKSPQDKEIKRDLKTGLIVIGIFVVLIFALWLLFGRNGELLKLTDNIKL